MLGVSWSVAQHAGRAPAFNDFLSSPSVNDSGGIHEASLQIFDNFPFQRPTHNTHVTLPVVAAIVFLLLFMYFCGYKENNESGVRGRIRRVAGTEGKEEAKNAGSKMEDVCGVVEKAVSLKEPAHTAPPRPLPASAEVVFGKEEPRKRKRKTRWLEQDSPPAAQPAKKARKGESLISLLKPFCSSRKKL